jgi:Family of unknown function (DUF6352)
VRDFWRSCGHALTDRGADGRLQVTDAFLKAYLARPELMPPSDSCAAERALHAALLAAPRRPIDTGAIAAVADPDARENWAMLQAFRDHLLRHGTLEAAYLELIHSGAGGTPPLFLGHLVHVILRNALDGCDDPFVVRAAELFFRPQRIALCDGALIAADAEIVAEAQGEIDVMTDDSAAQYWERSDRFDMALDLSAGGRGIAALGTAIAAWLRHLLALDASVAALRELRDARLTWYVGLDADGTRIGDALWRGEGIDDATRARLAGLFCLSVAKAPEPVYLILAMTLDRMLRMKPQNLLTGLRSPPQ